MCSFSAFPIITCRWGVSNAEVRHYVSSMTALETLHFSDDVNTLHDKDLAAALENLSTLRTLVMPSSHPIRKFMMGQVAQLSTLQALDLSTQWVSLP